jgi:hypothetical protein
MNNLPPSSSAGPQPFSALGVVSAFDAAVYNRTQRTLFRLKVGQQLYECWSARPLRRLPENGAVYRVNGYSLGNEVHVVTILRDEAVTVALKGGAQWQSLLSSAGSWAF